MKDRHFERNGFVVKLSDTTEGLILTLHHKVDYNNEELFSLEYNEEDLAISDYDLVKMTVRSIVSQFIPTT